MYSLCILSHIYVRLNIHYIILPDKTFHWILRDYVPQNCQNKQIPVGFLSFLFFPIFNVIQLNVLSFQLLKIDMYVADRKRRRFETRPHPGRKIQGKQDREIVH